MIEALRRYAMVPAKPNADNTPIPVLGPVKGKTMRERLCVYVRGDRRSGSTQPATVWFAYSPDRQGFHPRRISPDSKAFCRRTATVDSPSCTKAERFVRQHAGITPVAIWTRFTSPDRQSSRRRHST
ncbi:transposase [Burkholderia sp. 9775_39]|nr:transposase [Burkholderia sp. 9775_39]MBG0887696.1 transposase [Burkholderia sp. 9773_38]